MNLDGSGDALVTSLLPQPDLPGDVEIDLTTRKLYWQESGGGVYTQRIQRANLDGTGVETLFEAPPRDYAYYGITLDVANQYLYRNTQDASGLMQVYRMNTDGTDHHWFFNGDPGWPLYIQYSPVPEPSSLAMICGVILVGGLLSVISRRRLRR